MALDNQKARREVTRVMESSRSEATANRILQTLKSKEEPTLGYPVSQLIRYATAQ